MPEIRSFGHVCRRRFSQTWQDRSDPVTAGLKDRLPLRKLPLQEDLWRLVLRPGRDRHRRSVGRGPRLLPQQRGDRRAADSTDQRGHYSRQGLLRSSMSDNCGAMVM